MELTEELKDLLIKTGKQLKGSARRLFMARTVKTLGPGGASRAERDLGWNRKTIRKGMHELESSISCVDAFGSRRRKRSEELLPNLLEDIRAIVDGQSQTDPQFKTNRLYTRLSAPEVRPQLISQKGYREEELPTATAIATKLNQLGYYPTKVAKSKPKKAGGHRCHLRTAQRGQCGSRYRPGGGAHFHGCQSHGQGRRLLTQRQEARTRQSGRPRF
jgi:hypothetical protein